LSERKKNQMLLTVRGFRADQFHDQRSILQNNERQTESVHIWAWLNQGHFSEKTKEVYIRIVKDFLAKNWTLQLRAVTPAIVTIYLRSKDGLSVSSRNLYRNTLSSLFQYLENIDYVKKNPVKITKKEKSNDEFYFKILSLSQIKKMLQSTDSERDQLLILTLYYTGLRVSELSSIKVSDFMQNHQNKTKGSYLTVKGKGGKLRTILTGPELWNKVKKFIKKNRITKNQYLFSFENQPLSRIRIYKIIKSLTLRAKVKTPGNKTPSPHWFRHTSAIHAIENGADIQIVQATLGHASLATTGKYLKSRPIKSNSSFLKKI
jgi:integrase/recombinase XerD